jgi:hypothetical protein
VQFKLNEEKCYGNIQEIFQIENAFFFKIKTFEKKIDRNFLTKYSNIHVNNALKNNVYDYFIPLDYEKFQYVIVTKSDIITKCIWYLNRETKKCWASPCFNIGEHD